MSTPHTIEVAAGKATVLSYEDLAALAPEGTIPEGGEIRCTFLCTNAPRGFRRRCGLERSGARMPMLTHASATRRAVVLMVPGDKLRLMEAWPVTVSVQVGGPLPSAWAEAQDRINNRMTARVRHAE